MLDERILGDYLRLIEDCGFVPLKDWTLIQISGADRLVFMHNFCTADIKKLAPGHATEAFILNSKGKLLGDVYLIATENQLLLYTVPGQSKALSEHLDKYIIREDVQMIDVSNEFTSVFVTGPKAEERLKQLCKKLPENNEVVTFDFAGQPVEISQLELAGWGYVLVVPNSIREVLNKRLLEFGIGSCSEVALHVVRIERSTPWFGIDTSEKNLPQELRRDERAISFDKGCYLGQETVARIDAIGHVNRLLTSLKLAGLAPAGSALFFDNKEVGRLTSVCWSPRADSWVGLGFLKRSLCKPGKEILVDDVKALVEAS